MKDSAARASGQQPCGRVSVQSADSKEPGHGSLDRPPFDDLLFAPLFTDGDAIVAAPADEPGTIMVKRYRLVLPGER